MSLLLAPAAAQRELLRGTAAFCRSVPLASSRVAVMSGAYDNHMAHAGCRHGASGPYGSTRGYTGYTALRGKKASEQERSSGQWPMPRPREHVRAMRPFGFCRIGPTHAGPWPAWANVRRCIIHFMPPLHIRTAGFELETQTMQFCDGVIIHFMPPRCISGDMQRWHKVNDTPSHNAWVYTYLLDLTCKRRALRPRRFLHGPL